MPHYRPVQRHLLHGQLLSFRELCEAAIPTSAKFIVFDLDRTLHLARNIGEFMGWELGALHSYGADYLDKVEGSRAASRFLVSRTRPIASSKYVLRGARAWAYSGLFYLLWGRMAGRFQPGQQLRHRVFGPEPVTAIQELPTLAFMHELGGVSVEMAARLAERLLTRFAGDQVFDRDDISWLRARCPDAKIILSSASPRPTVEAGAKLLGIDDWESAEIEVFEDRYCSPFQLGSRFLHDQEPKRLSRPSLYRLNAGRAKIRRLLARFPEMAEAENEVVGITDTWHGEDHCWADHFTRVVDVNSTTPFSPLVVSDSPLQEIHSAQILSTEEQRRRTRGEASYEDPRRTKRLSQPVAMEYDSKTLSSTLAEHLERSEELGARRLRLRGAGSKLHALQTREIETVLEDIEDAVCSYNEAVPGARKNQINTVIQLVQTREELLRKRAKSQRELSEVSLAFSHLLFSARATLEERAC